MKARRNETVRRRSSGAIKRKRNWRNSWIFYMARLLHELSNSTWLTLNSRRGFARILLNWTSFTVDQPSNGICLKNHISLIVFFISNIYTVAELSYWLSRHSSSTLVSWINHFQSGQLSSKKRATCRVDLKRLQCEVKGPGRLSFFDRSTVLVVDRVMLQRSIERCSLMKRFVSIT